MKGTRGKFKFLPRKKMSEEKRMIDPFVEKLVKKNVLSYGLSSYGSDARVSREFKIFTNVNSATVDPKKFSESSSCLLCLKGKI